MSKRVNDMSVIPNKANPYLVLSSNILLLLSPQALVMAGSHQLGSIPIVRGQLCPSPYPLWSYEWNVKIAPPSPPSLGYTPSYWTLEQLFYWRNRLKYASF